MILLKDILDRYCEASETYQRLPDAGKKAMKENITANCREDEDFLRHLIKIVLKKGRCENCGYTYCEVSHDRDVPCQRSIEEDDFINAHTNMEVDIEG